VSVGLVCVRHRAPGRSCDRPTKSRLTVAFSKCQVVAQNPRPTGCFSCGIPSTNVKISPKRSLFKCRQNADHATQNQPRCSIFLLCSILLKPTLHRSIYSTSQRNTLPQTYLYQRTSGYSPNNIQDNKLLFSAVSANVLPLTTPFLALRLPL
jgi:hypothetical protein